MRRAAVRCRHDRSWEDGLCRIGRAHRGLPGDDLDGGRNGPEPERAEAAAEDGAGRLFCFAMQSALAKRMMRLLIAGARRKIAGRSHCRPGPLAVRSPSRRPRSRPLPPLASSMTGLSRSIERRWLIPRPPLTHAENGRRPPTQAETARLFGGHRDQRCADLR